MAYNKYYSLPFKDYLNRSCEVEIYKNASAPGAVVELIGSQRPAITQSQDADKSLFTSIRGQALVVEIVSDNLLLTTFSDNSDVMWRANLLIDGVTMFVGYLVTDECAEDYVDYNHVLRLTFTDGLALLKQIPIKDGANDPYGFYHPYDVMRLCLNQTGLTLPINLHIDISQNGTFSSGFSPFRALTSIDAKSMMADSASFKDAYTVLSDLAMSFNLNVYQYKGEWYITSWSRYYVTGGFYKYHYSADDLTITSTAAYNPVLSIGASRGIKEVNSPLLFSIQRPAQYIKLQYNFQAVPEIMRNLDLQEGAIISSGSTDTYLTPAYFTQTGRTAKTHVKLNGYGYEYERRMEIDGAADFSDHTKYIRSEDINVMKGDTLTLKLSYKQEATTSVNSASLIFQVYLDGLFGTDYTLEENGTWQASTTSIVTGFGRTSIDDDNFYVFDLDTNALPDSGRVHIKFFIGDAGAGGRAVYRNMNIEYNGVITNRFKNTKGEYLKISTGNTVKSKIEQTIPYNTSYSQLWNGSFIDTTGAFNTPENQDYQRYGVTEEKSMIELVAIGYYHQMKRSKLFVDGILYGTHGNDSGSFEPVGYVQRYAFDDIPNKYFYLIDLPELDWRRGIWKGTFIEIYDTAIDSDMITYPDAEKLYVSK